MKQAIFTHSNEYDYIVLANGTAIKVDRFIYEEFANVSEQKNFSNWNGNSVWKSENANTIEEAAQDYGETVAYFEDNKLFVVDAWRWNERFEFYVRNEKGENVNEVKFVINKTGSSQLYINGVAHGVYTSEETELVHLLLKTLNVREADMSTLTIEDKRTFE